MGITRKSRDNGLLGVLGFWVASTYFSRGLILTRKKWGVARVGDQAREGSCSGKTMRRCNGRIIVNTYEKWWFVSNDGTGIQVHVGLYFRQWVATESSIHPAGKEASVFYI